MIIPKTANIVQKAKIVMKMLRVFDIELINAI